MSTQQRSANVAMIAAVTGGALLAAFLVQKRRDAELNRSEAVPTDTKSTTMSQQKRMTLEEILQDEDLTVKPIGTVRSIYRLCVGTPRQGLLAPHARGRLELNGDISQDAVLELDGFSHVWVLFVFHLNIVSKNQRVPTKIAPPALGGKKVGVLATRSPHRLNPIGMTLCKLDSITPPAKQSPNTVLNVSGLDLCDGTPILDIKPYVPHYDSVSADKVRLPPWVSEGLATRRPVHIESKALNELEDILVQDPNALEFYGRRSGDKSMEETMKAATHCIAEILSIDVRSKWQTNKARDSNFQAERSERIQTVLVDGAVVSDSERQCTQQFDNLLVYYTVKAPEQHERSTSQGSGAEDVVKVNSIKLLKVADSSSKADTTVVEDDAKSEVLDKTDKESVPLEATETPAIEKNRTETEETPTTSAPLTDAETPTHGSPPTDADYKSLKNYWAQAASRNTPTGLVPQEGLGRQQSQKFFVFSAKQATPQRIPRTESAQGNVSKAAMIHPMDDEDASGGEQPTPDEVPASKSEES